MLLVRHPKPVIAPGICYGASDIPAIPEALDAAFAWLDNLVPNNAHLVSSPLLRCAEIARRLYAAAPKRTLEFDARIAERDCGSWELVPWDAVPRAELDAWAADFLDFAAANAESVRIMQSRVLTAWHDLQAACVRPVVWITHAGPIQVLLAHVCGQDLTPAPVTAVQCGEMVALHRAETYDTSQSAERWQWQWQVLTAKGLKKVR
jgi:alpha-ribazole phosphatase